MEKTFLLQLVKWHSSINLQLCSQPYKRPDLILAEIELKAPMTATSEILKFPFQGPFNFQPSWITNPTEGNEHYVSGFLTASIIWGRAPDATTRIPPVPKQKNLGLEDNPPS